MRRMIHILALRANLIRICASLAPCCLLSWSPLAAYSSPASSCDDSLKASFRPDKNTAVTKVHLFKKGEDLNLDGTPSGKIAANDLCLVKLNVGPGNPGPKDAPSTSAGIGIEIWLPSAAHWNGRLHMLGTGGFSGTTEFSSLTKIAGVPMSAEFPAYINASGVAATEGSVAAITDTGHTDTTGAFTLNPDGSNNERLWEDFAGRAIHEMTIKSKALAQIFYGKKPDHSYWDGCSSGGMQGLKEAQDYPDDFDGLLIGAPAINWTRFIPGSMMYPGIVVQRDLAGVPLTEAQLALLGAAAVSSCDAALNGQHDGFISNPASCKYDPVSDESVICSAEGGKNTTAACVTKIQAQAMNKMWYGLTADGSVPSPKIDNGFHDSLSPDQLWFGWPRGTHITEAFEQEGGMIGVHQAAISLQDPRIAGPDFHNATGNGTNGWKNLSYSDMARIQSLGISRQKAFSHINADSPDLTRNRDRNVRIIHYHGMADYAIPVQGSYNYYSRVAAVMGGYANVQKFYRFYPIPAWGHCGRPNSFDGIAGISPPSDAPEPVSRILFTDELFAALVNWTEKKEAPDHLSLSNRAGTVSRPLCAYPQKISYLGGPREEAASYECK